MWLIRSYAKTLPGLDVFANPEDGRFLGNTMTVIMVVVARVVIWVKSATSATLVTSCQHSWAL